MTVVKCTYCGGGHDSYLCPRVKEIEFYENGKIKNVVLNDLQSERKPFKVHAPQPKGEVVEKTASNALPFQNHHGGVMYQFKTNEELMEYIGTGVDPNES